jgi:integrase
VLDSSEEVTHFVATWRPRGVAPEAGVFARAVVGPLNPTSALRARSLLWAASRLCAFALECGLVPEPGDVLTLALIERFIARGTRGWSHGARRTLRSNLLFLYRRVKQSDPLLVPISRERSALPYRDAELAAYLALADAQPTPARRSKASALIALGAGAGLLGVDLRLVRGADVVARSGGVIVVVHGPRARVVPVRAELAERALHCARFAGAAFLVGGAEPTRRNVTSALIASLAKGPDLERLSLARLRATWVARCAADIGLATFLAAAGVRCSQRLGDVVATLDPGDEATAVAVLGGTC